MMANTAKALLSEEKEEKHAEGRIFRRKEADLLFPYATPALSG
jgi:hypothetical protein